MLAMFRRLLLLEEKQDNVGQWQTMCLGDMQDLSSAAYEEFQAGKNCSAKNFEHSSTMYHVIENFHYLATNSIVRFI